MLYTLQILRIRRDYSVSDFRVWCAVVLLSKSRNVARPVLSCAGRGSIAFCHLSDASPFMYCQPQWTESRVWIHRGWPLIIAGRLGHEPRSYRNASIWPSSDSSAWRGSLPNNVRHLKWFGNWKAAGLCQHLISFPQVSERARELRIPPSNPDPS